VTPRDLSPDQLLSTTRAVRKRLDLSRPVERELLQECLDLAFQAPTGGNPQGWHFVLVTEASRKRAISELYRRSKRENDPASTPPGHQRGMDSSAYLAQHLHEVPVLVVPCIEGRVENAPLLQQAVTWGSILPATWSFMLAARARSLGTAWTSLHLAYEQEAAAVLEIPYQQVMQVMRSSPSPTPSAQNSSPGQGPPAVQGFTGTAGSAAFTSAHRDRQKRAFTASAGGA
jgi:nitroreductase